MKQIVLIIIILTTCFSLQAEEPEYFFGLDDTKYITKDGYVLKHEKYDIRARSNFYDGIAMAHLIMPDPDWEPMKVPESYKEILTPEEFEYLQKSELKPKYIRKLVYINKKGEVVLEDIMRNYSAGVFINGIARTTKTKNETHGFINKKGEWVIQPIYRKISLFENNRAYVTLKKDNKFLDGIIDRKGNYILEPQEKYNLISLSEGMIIIQTGNHFNNFKYGYMRASDGKVIVEPKYNYVRDFHDGYALINSRFFIDKTGKRATQFWAPYIGDYMKSLSGTWGFIDRQGNMVIEPQYQGRPRIQEGGVASVKVIIERGKYYYAIIDIDKNGRIIEKEEPYEIGLKEMLNLGYFEE